jgi:hypothetical protein
MISVTSQRPGELFVRLKQAPLSEPGMPNTHNSVKSIDGLSSTTLSVRSNAISSKVVSVSDWESNKRPCIPVNKNSVLELRVIKLLLVSHIDTKFTCDLSQPVNCCLYVQCCIRSIIDRATFLGPWFGSDSVWG